MSSRPSLKSAKIQPILWLLIALLGLSLAAGMIFTACKPHSVNDDPDHSMPVMRHSVSIFFSKTQGSKSIVENVTRQLPTEHNLTPLKFALQELLKGPTPEEKSQGFYTEIPKGTQLLGLNRQSHTVIINLSHQFSSGGGSTSMTQRLEQVKQTVYAMDDSHHVNLSVEGKPLETLGGEGLEVPESLKREQQ
jgi:spore germination protein GerM